jgi:LysM domain
VERKAVMTVLDTGQRMSEPVLRPTGSTRTPHRRDLQVRRPGPVRPAPGAMPYRGTGVMMSRAPHRGRPVSIGVTVAVAGLAALITVWLGAIAQSGGVAGTPATVPEQLAVVQVQAGDTLQGLAGRVAPDAPVGHVVARIKELNQLESSALDAGQTLIAPVGPSADDAR